MTARLETSPATIWAMNTAELQDYLHKHIPISRAMGVRVLEAAEEAVRLSAPLAPNINHRETVFGGSASAVAILSAWALLFLRLRGAGLYGRVVIYKSSITYEQPITDTFTASSALSDPTAWDKFIKTLGRKNRARIRVRAVLDCHGTRVAEMEGQFVALALPAKTP